MVIDSTVRPIRSEQDLRTFHRMIITTFVGVEKAGSTLDAYDANMRTLPDVADDARRGIFVRGELVCACVVYSRQLRLGHAYVPTACIGAVMTHPDHRGRGLASQLMEDVVHYATARGDGLLLLDGVSRFYDRFGYVSVHNWTQFTLQVDEIRATPAPAGPAIRPATAADAAVLHGRYRRHFGRYTGSFRRSEELQRHYMHQHALWNNLHLAEREADQPCGDLRYSKLEVGWSSEVTADDPETARALLHFHAEDAHRHATAALHWLVPPHSDLADWLADRYEVVVRTPVQPYGGWMARIAAADVLLTAMTPTWQAAWLAGTCGWHGRFALAVGTDRRWIDIGPRGVSVSKPAADEGEPPADHLVRITPEVFVQLCFGYRTAQWAAAQPGVAIPLALLPVTATLFPRRQTWIAGSDFF